jgi:uncharacterized protein YjlB
VIALRDTETREDSEMPAKPVFFTDDGDVPNNPRWPMIVYYQAIDAGVLIRSEFAFDELFQKNGWVVRFRNGIYPFTHYHTTAHEALGIARGHATVQFGGDLGSALTAAAGDALLLPAGTGHRLMSASPDLLVVGAYPPGPDRDLMRTGEHDKAGIRSRIAAVAKPRTDPVTGSGGPMLELWQ